MYFCLCPRNKLATKPFGVSSYTCNHYYSVKQKSFLLYIFVLLFCAESFSQAILAPDLQCVVNDAVNGDITLYWTNPPANPCGAFVQYNIYASQTGPSGPFNPPVAVVNQAATSFLLAGYLSASPTWYFYMEAVYNCPGATTLQSDTVNNLSPVVSQIINVDVTPNNDAIFNWQPSVSPQTHAYIIYYYLPGNGGAVPLDTIYGRFNTTFTDLAGVFADPHTDTLYFTIAALDSCGKISMYSTLAHNTIFASASTATCSNQLNLNWNKYNNWPLGVKEYQIWVSTNLGPYTNVGAVDSSTTSYAYTGFADGDSLCVAIRAVSAADTNVFSNSNYLCLKPTIVQPPSYNYITNATVDLDNHVTITWAIDPAAELLFYVLERSGNNNTFEQVEQIDAPAPVNPVEVYVDSVGVQPEHNPYYYTVNAFDSCQNQFKTPYVKTVCLKGELYDYYIANLTWNDFELNGATVLYYNLYRNYGSGYQLIRTFPVGTNSYSDSLQQFLAENGIFCYRIEAVYDLNLPTANIHDTLSSFSNEMCIIHRPIIYIPNAFAPGGVNNVFKPTIIYGEPKAYTMQIYNRYGGKVFESNDPNLGWDGIDHGKEAQQGGYAYLIQFYANDGVKVERKGMVLLVR